MSEDSDRQNAEVRNLLEQLVKGGCLEGPARGIARQVIARGEASLSERQGYVFSTQVEAKYLLRVCGLCEELIPLSEVMGSLDNGLCASCAAILGK